MRKVIILLTACAFSVSSMIAQSKSYVSSTGEMIFSFADITQNGYEQSSTIRWAPVINLQGFLNNDFSPKAGIFTGLALRNVGYIMDNYKNENFYNGDIRKKKFRSYNVGIPVGIKLGNLDKMFFYGGYELEVAALYKEKTFLNDTKENKLTEWFSDRQELFQHGFFVGVQFPYGMNVKFKYYLTEFHNQEYVDIDGKTPYDGLKSNVFYFSLSYYPFKKLSF